MVKAKQSCGFAEVHRETAGAPIDRMSRVAALGMLHNGRMQLRCFVHVTIAAVPEKLDQFRAGRAGSAVGQ